MFKFTTCIFVWKIAINVFLCMHFHNIFCIATRKFYIAEEQCFSITFMKSNLNFMWPLTQSLSNIVHALHTLFFFFMFVAMAWWSWCTPEHYTSFNWCSQGCGQSHSCSQWKADWHGLSCASFQCVCCGSDSQVVQHQCVSFTGHCLRLFFCMQNEIVIQNYFIWTRRQNSYSYSRWLHVLILCNGIQ